MSIGSIRKAYQEAVKEKENNVLDKIRKGQAESVVQKAITDATVAARKLEKSISFTFGAHPVTARFALEALELEGFSVKPIRCYRESNECVMTSLILSGWSEQEELVNTEDFNNKIKDLGILVSQNTDFSPYSLDNATEISKKMKNANIDTELIKRVVSRGFKNKTIK